MIMNEEDCLKNTPIDFVTPLPKFFSAKGKLLKKAFFDFFKPKIGRKVRPLAELIQELGNLCKSTNSEVVQTNYKYLVEKTDYSARVLRECFAILEKFNIAKRDIKTRKPLFIEIKISPQQLKLLTKKEKESEER